MHVTAWLCRGQMAYIQNADLMQHDKSLFEFDALYPSAFCGVVFLQ